MYLHFFSKLSQVALVHSTVVELLPSQDLQHNSSLAPERALCSTVHADHAIWSTFDFANDAVQGAGQPVDPSLSVLSCILHAEQGEGDVPEATSTNHVSRFIAVGMYKPGPESATGLRDAPFVGRRRETGANSPLVH